jgi:hypothetical protein
LQDAGSRSASAAGLDNYTEYSDQTPDIGQVDIGFHYLVKQLGLVSVNALQSAIRPGHPNSRDGYFIVQTTGPDYVVASFNISGTAQPGVDYTSLPGSVLVSPLGPTTISVHPLQNGPDIDKTVTLTLQPSMAYNTDPDLGESATVSILNDFPVVSAFAANPVGIDYDPINGTLVMSEEGGDPVSGYDFFQLGTDTQGGLKINSWSAVTGLQEEAKLVIVKTSANGFVAGQVFFGNNPDGSGVSARIGSISPDGSVVNLAFATLPNDFGLLRGGLCLDETGVFGGQLIAVTQGGGVWTINSAGQSHHLAQIAASALEGVITLPNNPAQWGPWAGRIITGDETTGIIYAIDVNGTVTSFNTTDRNNWAVEIDSEDFDIIQPNQTLYSCVGNLDKVVELSGNFLSPYAGSLLIGDEPNTRLVVVSWNNLQGKFITQTITFPDIDFSQGQPECSTFAPINLPTQ